MLESLNIIKRNTFYLAIAVVLLGALATWELPEPERNLKPDDRLDIIFPQSTPATKDSVRSLAIDIQLATARLKTYSRLNPQIPSVCG